MLKDSLHEAAQVVSDTAAKVISITAIAERISDAVQFLSRKVKLIPEDIVFIKEVASPAYNEKDFYNLVDKYGIDHNSVITAFFP